MSQRTSGYERKERDLYETPEWVTLELLAHFKLPSEVWEPAAASGKMSRALGLAASVHSGDIAAGSDFLKITSPPGCATAIITNPPYDLAKEFIGHALDVMFRRSGKVAMLLRTDFDHAKTRQDLFGRCPQFAKKIVLTKRIKWFENSTGQPSFNHAWFIWDWKHSGPPTLAYGP